MSTENSNISSLLAKLDTALGNKKKPGGGKKDWAAINEARKKAFWKPKEGKNQILVFCPDGTEDPFVFWGFHKNLQEVDYYSVPCDHANKNEDCVICNVVNSLKEENWEGQRYLWSPIEQKTETYVPVIDLTSSATMAEGPKWFRVSKTIMNAMINNIKNLEEGEVPFFDTSAPMRITITYDKTLDPKSQYDVSFKAMKDVPTEEQYAAWQTELKPVGEWIFSKSQDEIKKLVDEYFVRMAELADASQNENEESKPEAETEEVVLPAESKLAKLKNKK